MNKRQKIELRNAFFAKVGTNAAIFKAMLDAAPLLCFYMKDLDGRIMALNRRNCEVCNIRNEWDAIGLRSNELFPEPYASDYMALDHEVLKSGKPVLGHISQYPADRSKNFMISDVYPLKDANGQIVGTARAYVLTAQGSNRRYGRMRTAITYIEEHLAEEILLSDLAALAGMTVTSFKRQFEVTFKMPPGKYLLRARINAAMERLGKTDEKLSEIARATGFYDQSHLTRIFKQERGTTPGEYRRQQRRTASESR